MKLILKKGRSFRFKGYRFLPNKPVEVTNENDIYDLLQTGYVEEYRAKRIPLERALEEQDWKGEIIFFNPGGLGDNLLTFYVLDSLREERDLFDYRCIVAGFRNFVQNFTAYSEIEYKGVYLPHWEHYLKEKKENKDVKLLVHFKWGYFPEVIKDEFGFTKQIPIPETAKEAIQELKKGTVIETMASVFGIKKIRREIYLTWQEETWAKEMRKMDYIIFHIAENRHRRMKSWPLKRWERLAKMVEKLGKKIIQIGERGEPAIDQAINLQGIGARWLLVLLRGARALITTDSGIMHLAEGLGIPKIVLWGSTPAKSLGWHNDYTINISQKICNEACWNLGPYGYKCEKGRKKSCLDSITEEEVFEAIQELLKKERKRGNKIEVSIVIPFRNLFQMTMDCIESICNSERSVNFEIILVDNGSRRYPPSFRAAARKRGVIFIRNPENLGYPKAVNIGVKASKGKYILIMNNDVIVRERGFLKQLIDQERRRPGIIGLSGGIINKEGNFGGFTVSKFDYLEGWFLFMRREIYDKLGGLDEVFSPGYYEDTDFSFRARKAGIGLSIAKMDIEHLRSRTLEEEKENFHMEEVMKKNREIFLQRHADML
ncbi:MAG: hypothetical protein DRO18_03660 [Thermoprotei archaeon]|nr:MAG: hypothetical protein DRO18_03660 [Thermoprotei archaeon]